MEENEPLALATPMPARERWTPLAPSSLSLSLTDADVAELDPHDTGVIVLFGIDYYADDEGTLNGATLECGIQF